MNASVWLAVGAAIAGAASFGTAGLLQNSASSQAPKEKTLRPQLLVELMRIRPFRWSVVLSILGFALQATALRFGPLGLVQPILVTGVLFYLGAAAVSRHRLPDLRLVGAAVLTTVGLAAFLLSADPGQGHGPSGARNTVGGIWVGAVLLGILVACLIAAGFIRRYRAIPLATASAICFGSTASLARSLLDSANLQSPFGQWQLYVIIVLGPAGFLLNQNAFQAGRAGSVAVALITVGDPIVAITIGAAWLDEPLSSGALRLAIDAAALVAITAGIVLLNLRAEAVSREVGGDTSTPEAA
ncbi:MAG TPA: DMT family transporter [Amnibacterium sp.]|jgi:drug/metabolite transporter (DMT)-like permease|nr:DMT family transporter [Amnibacterium sp.]